MGGKGEALQFWELYFLFQPSLGLPVQPHPGVQQHQMPPGPGRAGWDRASQSSLSSWAHVCHPIMTNPCSELSYCP